MLVFEDSRSRKARMPNRVASDEIVPETGTSRRAVTAVHDLYTTAELRIRISIGGPTPRLEPGRKRQEPGAGAGGGTLTLFCSSLSVYLTPCKLMPPETSWGSLRASQKRPPCALAGLRLALPRPPPPPNACQRLLSRERKSVDLPLVVHQSPLPLVHQFIFRSLPPISHRSRQTRGQLQAGLQSGRQLGSASVVPQAPSH